MTVGNQEEDGGGERVLWWGETNASVQVLMESFPSALCLEYARYVSYKEKKGEGVRRGGRREEGGEEGGERGEEREEEGGNSVITLYSVITL